MGKRQETRDGIDKEVLIELERITKELHAPLTRHNLSCNTIWMRQERTYPWDMMNSN